MGRKQQGAIVAPPGVNIAGVKKYLTAFEAPRAENRRLLAALLAVSIVAVALAFAIARMIPLKERIPYFVTIDPTTGAVQASDRAAVEFTPSDASKRYFLAQWAQNLLVIDDRTKDEHLPASYAMLRGTALGEWQSFEFNQWNSIKRLTQNPQLRVYANVDNVALLGNDSAIIRVTTHSTDDESVKHLIITVRFAIIHPQTDAEIYRNPIGLWILHFEVNNEAQQQ